jgi:hypothetical protein
VHAHDEVEATRLAWARGMNPGGEIMLMVIDEHVAGRLPFSLEPYEWRLLPPAEASQLAELVSRELGA